MYGFSPPNYLVWNQNINFWPKIWGWWNFSASLLLDTFINSAFRLSNIQCVTRNTKKHFESTCKHTHITTTVAVGKERCPDFSPLLHSWRWAARNRWSRCGAPSNTHTHTFTWKWVKDQTDGEETAPSSPSWAWHCTENDTKGQHRITSVLY